MRYYFILLLIILSCKSPAGKPIQISGFDPMQWKGDSLGCNGYRKMKAEILRDSIGNILFHSGKELSDFLGNANDTIDHQGFLELLYFVNTGRQCYDNNWRKGVVQETEHIYVELDKTDKVIGISGVMVN